MKKTLIALSAMVVALSFTACNEDVITTGNDTPQAKTVIKAYTETSATRTALSDNGDGFDVVWSTGDKFTLGSNEFELTDGAETTSGTFEGTLPADGNYTACYPTTYNGTDWPTTQTYTAGNIVGSPMTAAVTVADGAVSGPVEFKNAGGILCLTVKGSATVKCVTVNATELSAPITLDCGSTGVALTSDGVDFYIAMPAKTYTGVSIKLTDIYDNVCTKTLKSNFELVINRSEITDASFKFTYKAGDKVTIDGHGGIVVDLGTELGKVIVATMNVGATSVNEDGCLGDQMTYDAACAVIGTSGDWSGWRLPTVDEFTAFCDPFYSGVCGSTDIWGCTGAVMWYIDGVDGIDLYLPLNDNDEDANPSDIYWTGTPGSDGTYYYYAPAIEFDGDYSPLELDFNLPKIALGTLGSPPTIILRKIFS